MGTPRNPFKPTAGARPPLLVGRDEIREDFAESIENGAGAPGLLSIYSGARGIGETVMLGEIEDEAIHHGWIVISETATEGLVRRIYSAIRKHKAELLDGPAGRRITGVKLGPLEVAAELAPTEDIHWRTILTELLQKLDENGTGLLITVDEIHGIDRGELAEIATVVQHMIREELPIGMAFAGLPKAVEDLLNEGVTTFLRRAEKYDLNTAPIQEVANAFRETFGDSGVEAGEEKIQQLAEATGGYPFLIQLVGYYVWSQASKSNYVVTDEALAAGLEKARRRMGTTVVQSAYQSLSDIDRSYILAMAEDNGPSRTSVVAQRLGVSQVYGGQYRLRLLAQGIIKTVAHGYVDFAVPTLREFLREQPAYNAVLHDPLPEN
ncbi:AAA family ATPase [Glutamicibacter sp. NPDC087344]|uniref:AAA family ATPase n=1 Tax=Glutamicibacter sp. NPDC087344 TaxID=3363994 RepID=UPI0038274E4F